MAERSKKTKKPPEMRSAAIFALIAVIALCVLFLLVVLPLRAMIETRRQEALEASAPTPAPTAEPTPSPTPRQPSVLTFDESSDDPMPAENSRLTLGKGYRFRGTVQSNYPLRTVSLEVTCEFSENLLYPYVRTVSFSPESAVYSYPLDDALTAEGASLDSLAQFSELGAGIHTLKLFASSEGEPVPKLLFETRFYILSDQ